MKKYQLLGLILFIFGIVQLFLSIENTNQFINEFGTENLITNIKIVTAIINFAVLTFTLLIGAVFLFIKKRIGWILIEIFMVDFILSSLSTLIFVNNTPKLYSATLLVILILLFIGWNLKKTLNVFNISKKELIWIFIGTFIYFIAIRIWS